MENAMKIILDELAKVNANVLKLGEQIGERLNHLEERMDHADERMDNLEDAIKELDKQIRDIRITLENVTNPNITIIAEGHLDLVRKLEDALRVENDREIMRIRLNALADDVRRLKERSAESAQTSDAPLGAKYSGLAIIRPLPMSIAREGLEGENIWKIS